MKHTIWSNMNLDLDDWRDDLLEEYPDCSEDELYRIMWDTNQDYLDDERANLHKTVEGVIVVIADLGLWNGRRPGFKVIESGNIADILYDEACDYCDWYADDKDIRFTGHHHDGTNHYLYRVFKGNPDDLYDMTPDEMIQATTSLRPHVAAVYGW